MMDWLKTAGNDVSEHSLGQLLLRLTLSLVLGCVVALIYRFAKPARSETHAFATTLVLLCVVIAMVTQVIGDNVARAFSLVGALSIVRFRTVVQDTRDTAYVIFSVVVGMAVGASNLSVALSGIVVVAIATFLFRALSRKPIPVSNAERKTKGAQLTVRMTTGHDPATNLHPLLARASIHFELVTVETARRGVSLDCVYRLRLKPDIQPTTLVQELNRVDGVQSVELTRAARSKKKS